MFRLAFLEVSLISLSVIGGEVVREVPQFPMGERGALQVDLPLDPADVRLDLILYRQHTVVSDNIRSRQRENEGIVPIEFAAAASRAQLGGKTVADPFLRPVSGA